MFNYLFFSIRYLIRILTNLRRRLKRAPDYVVFILEEGYSQLDPPPGKFWQSLFFPPKPSLRILADQFRTVAHDPRVRGVILHLRPSLNHLHTLRDMIKELRDAGKHTVAWSNSYNSANYYVACAADEVLLQTGGMISELGIRRNFLFMVDALERGGLKADFVQISPFKSGPDMFTRKQMSAEAKQMANWLIDADYAEFIRGISESRNIDEKGAKGVVDDAPYTDLGALEAGVVDKVISEEDLPEYLGKEEKQARLSFWEGARRRLLRRPIPPPSRYVALLRIEGDIVDGRSGRPPYKPPVPLPFLLNERSGDLSVVQAARRALADRRAAAVVVYIDSGGGSSTASEAMTAALEKIAAVKPLVVAMGSVAASGGYYVSTPAHWIVAQPGTITGSIGVYSGKIVSAGLIEKLLFNRETLSRGQHATFYDGGRPFSEDERKMVWQSIKRTYDVFLDRVSSGRKMTREAVDAVGGGRVWSGRQAFKHGLVDELGGLDKALDKARQLAKLPSRAPLREIRVGKGDLGPLAQPTALIDYITDGLRMFNRGKTLCLFPLIWYDDSAKTK